MHYFKDIQDIINRLLLLDQKCHDAEIRARLVVMGGAALTAFMELHSQKRFRPTMDIDVSIVASTDEEKMQSYLMASGVQELGGIISLPPFEDFINEENWFEMEGGFTNIQVFVPIIELLVCSKVFSARPKDLDDLMNTDIIKECDIIKLQGMIKEYYENCIELSNPELNYYHLADIFRKHGIQWE